MNTLYHDLRYALRQLRRSPGFAAIAILTLALGIGANTAIFSVVNAVLLRPLPYAEPERLVQLYSAGFQEGRFSLSYPDVGDLRGLHQVFTDAAAFATQQFNFTGAGDPREIEAVFASAQLFPLLGVSPALGRTFTAEDERAPYVVLSNRLWVSAYGGDQSALGRSVSLDGKPYTVIGVMPAGFRFPDDGVELWAPIGGAFAGQPGAETDRHMHFFNTVARLQPGVTPKRLRADLATLAHRIDAERQTGGGGQQEMRIVIGGGGPPPAGGPPGGASERAGPPPTQFEAVPLAEEVVGDTRHTLYVLFGTVALVLLIACANAANLLVARANSRRREIVVRQALGAGRGRIARQILTESVLLSLAAGALGVLLSYWGLDLLLATWPDSLPRVSEVGIDGRVLTFTLAVSVVTGIGFGLLPALRASSPALEEALREDSGSVSGSRRRQRAQRVLVAAQLAVALVLLVGAGLLVRSFVRLLEVDLGYDTNDVLAARIRLTPSRYADRTAKAEFFRGVTEDLAGRPGVSAVTLSRTLPLSGSLMMIGIETRRIRPDDPDRFLPVATRVVGSDYFKAMRISLVEGRPFEAADREKAPAVVVVNTRLAKRLWPDQTPIGKHIPMGFPGGGDYEMTVVGTVGDIHYTGLSDEVRPEMYLPVEQFPEEGEQTWVILRVERNPLQLAGAVREAVRRADPTQPVAELVSLEQLVGRSTAARRFNMMLIGLFAGLAFVLAVIGVYGVTTYAVSQRTRELGIRMALGAQRGDVVRLVLREGLRLAAVGVFVGLAIAFAASRALTSMLFEVTTTDLATYAGTALLLAAATVLATYLPARRAAGVDPVIALRSE